MESVMQLDNWFKEADYPGTISGNVSKNPRFEDGTYVITSKVVAIDPEQGIIQTKSGSLYKLGTPLADYEAEFPGAREQLFKGSNLPTFRVNSL